VYFYHFGILNQEKSGNPDFDKSVFWLSTKERSTESAECRNLDEEEEKEIWT
jgi:hypothetical protein